MCVGGGAGSGAALILDEEYGRLRRGSEQRHDRKPQLAFYLFTEDWMKDSGALERKWVMHEKYSEYR